MKVRLIRIENIIKAKFQENFTSVRKAFLELDKDYDGFVTSEDIAQMFGKSETGRFVFSDLGALIKKKSSDPSKGAKLGFKDFCKWLGSAIQPCEGFYFRHDSVKNPQYEENKANQ